MGVGGATLTPGVVAVGVFIVAATVGVACASVESSFLGSGGTSEAGGGGVAGWKRWLPKSSSSSAESDSPSSELSPSSANSGPPLVERTVPMPSVCVVDGQSVDVYNLDVHVKW